MGVFESVDPIEELVAATVLMRPAEEGFGVDRRLVAFQFSHQKLCEQLLVRELARRIAPRVLPTGEEFLSWSRHAMAHDEDARDGFHELLGALEVMAARLATTGEASALVALFALEDESAGTRILRAALAALGPAWNDVDSGELIVALVVETLVAAASCTTWAAERFENAAGRTSVWLYSAGYSLAAAAIDRGRLTVMRGLVEREPTRMDAWRTLNRILNSLGHHLARVAGNDFEARSMFEESLALCRRLVELRPDRDDLREDLCVPLLLLGRWAHAERRDDEAQKYFDEEMALTRGLAAAAPGRVDRQRGLSASLNELGGLARSAGRIDAARGYFAEAVDVIHHLAESDPLTQLQLSASLSNLGKVEIEAGRVEEARSCFEEGLALIRRLVVEEPHRSDLRRALAVALADSADYFHRTGRLEDSRACFAEVVTTMRQLVAAEPHRSDLSADLAASLNNLGDVIKDSSGIEEAGRLFEESAALKHSVRSDRVEE